MRLRHLQRLDQGRCAALGLPELLLSLPEDAFNVGCPCTAGKTR